MKKQSEHVLFGLVFFIFIQLIFAGHSFSREISPEDKAEYEKIVIEKLKGWKGIVFICSVEEEAYKKLICDPSYRNFEFLAKSAKINYKIEHDYLNFNLSQLWRDPIAGRGSNYLRMIGLELNIQTVQRDLTNVVHFELTGTGYYSSGIDKSSLLDDDDPRKSPESFDVILWNRFGGGFGIFNGSKKELASSVSEAIEGNIKRFFVDFMKANPNL